jgi:hypothetical protein
MIIEAQFKKEVETTTGDVVASHIAGRKAHKRK